ncbi:hypothetical protein LAZ67_12002653 [Cordylochernes scorpioides]|uniref:Mos1 transposase HTH domain-containing protein n=1 Tax=Cordylochernes scorpioides TaxID=51811 RepID=A0ABY6L5F9_9ARAC|nr:hypothetical protein LAZ67_12002653 [Cordylochernes scorpioides]
MISLLLRRPSVTNEMEDQRICIKFCVKNGFKGAEIFWMLQTAYRDAVMSRRRVFEWYKRFKEGWEETADNERSGRPFTSTMPEKVDKVLELIRFKSARSSLVADIMKVRNKEPQIKLHWVVGHSGVNGNELGERAAKGRKNVHDDERSGRPVTATDNAAVAAVRNVVEADRRVTIDEIMIRLPPGIEIGRSSIGTIMSDVLDYRKVCA